MVKPCDHFIVAIGVGFFPVGEAMLRVGEHDEVAGHTGFLQALLKAHGLVRGYDRVRIALQEQEWRQTGSDVVNGRAFAQDICGCRIHGGWAVEQVLERFAQAAAGRCPPPNPVTAASPPRPEPGCHPAPACRQTPDVRAGEWPMSAMCPRIALEFARVGFDPANGGLDVLQARGPAIRRGQTVVDGKPGEIPLARQRPEAARCHATGRPACLSRRTPTAAMHDDDNGKRSGAVRHTGVEQQAFAAGPAGFDVRLKLPRQPRNPRCPKRPGAVW